MNRIQRADHVLVQCLNYGGIFIGGSPARELITLAWEQGERSDAIGQMRKTAAAFAELADALSSLDQNLHASNAHIS